MDTEIKRPVTTISAVITKKDGTVIDLGVISTDAEITKEDSSNG